MAEKILAADFVIAMHVVLEIIIIEQRLLVEWSTVLYISCYVTIT